MAINQFKFLESENYQDFGIDMYEKILKLRFVEYRKYLNFLHHKTNLSYKCSSINCLQYDYDSMELSIMCTEKYSGDYISHIIFHDNKISIDFIDYNNLFNNLIDFEQRYYPILNMIHLPGSNIAHATLFILDKIQNKAYLIDSNLDIITYYAQYFENPQLVQSHFHKAISKLFENIGYQYIPSIQLGIANSINKRNNEKNHKEFFKGYCMAWTFLFTDMILNVENSFLEIKDILNQIYRLTDYNRNELINNYHSYLYKIMEAIKY